MSADLQQMRDLLEVDKTLPSDQTTATTASVPVVVWDMESKRTWKCAVSVHTTFADIIRDLHLEGVQAALVGRTFGRPFKLLQCDWEPDVMSGAPPTKATTFKHELSIIVGWMNYLEDPYCSIEDAKTEIAEIYNHQDMLPQCLAGHTVHLFTYNHRDVDCCNGEHGPWSERDPNATTPQHTLWLQLEQDFILRNHSFMNRLGDNADWAAATLGAP